MSSPPLVASVPAAPLECRAGCGACCIAPSISTPLPAMPFGKPAGVPCAHLTADFRCELFGKPERPAVCVSLRPERPMCGEHRDEALATIGLWERLTRPGAPRDFGVSTRLRS